MHAGEPRTERNAMDDASAIEQLSQELEREIRQYRRWRFGRRLRQLFRIVIIAALVFTVLHGSWGPFMWLVLIFGGSEMTDAHSAQRRRTAGLLAESRDPRAVNVLAMARLSNDPATRTVATEGLMRILPTLKASDAKYITPQGMKALAGMLRPGRIRDIKFMLVVLDALKQVGTPDCIPAVERLLETPHAVRLLIDITDRWSYPVVGRNISRLQASAAECLQVLRLREKEEHDRSTLLRPAERPADEDQILLRPAMGGRPTDDITLVRPADGPQDVDPWTEELDRLADVEPSSQTPAARPADDVPAKVHPTVSGEGGGDAP